MRVIKSVCPAPSLACLPKEYLNYQNGEYPILDGRCGQIPTPLAPPVTVFHPAFAYFIGASCDTTQTPPRDIVIATRDAMNAASRIQVSEADRRASTREFLSKILSCQGSQIVNSNRTVADHTFLYVRPNSPRDSTAIAIVEEKAELGTGGDPSVQSYFSYFQFWKDNEACI